VQSPDDAIAAVLKESGPDYSDFSYVRPGGGHQSDVFMVTLERLGEEYEVVIKFEPDTVDSFPVEPKLHDYVAGRTDVPVPEILVFEQEPAIDFPPYFVTARLEGTNLADDFAGLDMDLRRRIVAQVGQILGDLHSEIAFEAYGWLDLWEERIIVRDLTGSWREYFEDLTQGHIEGLANTPFSDLAERARDRIDMAIGIVPEEGVPRLVHDDLRPANLLFDPEREEPITAVLDWQDVVAAHPEYHVAQTEFLFIDSSSQDPDVQAELRDILYEGYREVRSFAFDDEYKQRRALYQLSTLLWRMRGFEAAFADDSGLARARAEAQYREQFERLIEKLPTA
jgi:aminoglycoside phosphotransferase (APT) family kinase protein